MLVEQVASQMDDDNVQQVRCCIEATTLNDPAFINDIQLLVTSAGCNQRDSLCRLAQQRQVPSFVNSEEKGGGPVRARTAAPTY